MPKGNPSAQTRANEKYQSKAGYIAKTYKLKRELTEAFAQACEKAGVSQAAAISELMREFIEKNK
jgi:hypothetical protein|nr:MAG TPA: hypothetical protein [Caudoviricetes sp.]